MTYRIVNTDNFGGDYSNEKFVGDEYKSRGEAQEAADALNAYWGPNGPRYHIVVEMPYELQPGFEP